MSATHGLLEHLRSQFGNSEWSHMRLIPFYDRLGLAGWGHVGPSGSRRLLRAESLGERMAYAVYLDHHENVRQFTRRESLPDMHFMTGLYRESSDWETTEESHIGFVVVYRTDAGAIQVVLWQAYRLCSRCSPDNWHLHTVFSGEGSFGPHTVAVELQAKQRCKRCVRALEDASNGAYDLASPMISQELGAFVNEIGRLAGGPHIVLSVGDIGIYRKRWFWGLFHTQEQIRVRINGLQKTIWVRYHEDRLAEAANSAAALLRPLATRFGWDAKAFKA